MKSDREFIDGIYEKAAFRQELAATGNIELNIDNSRHNFRDRLNIFNITYIKGMSLAAACLIVMIAVVMALVKDGNFMINNDASKVTQPANENNGVMLLREVNLEFEVTVNVKNIIFEEDMVNIECAVLESSDKSIMAVDGAADTVFLMLKTEYDMSFPDGMEIGKSYALTVYETQDGFRIVPVIE